MARRAHSGRDEGDAWMQQHGLPLTKAALATATAGWPISHQQRTPESFLWLRSLGRSSSYLVAHWSHKIASVVEGAVFCSYWKRYMLYIQICLPCMRCFCQKYIHTLTGCLIFYHVFHTAFFFLIKKITSQQKNSNSSCTWNLQILLCSHHPEEAGLIGWWNGLLKSQLQHPLGGNTLQGWKKVLQRLYTPRISTSCMCCFSHSQILRSRNEGVQFRMARTTHYTPKKILAKCLLLIPMTLCSTSPELSVPEGGMLPPADTTMTLLNWKLTLPLCHYGFLMPLNPLSLSYRAGWCDWSWPPRGNSLLFNRGK